MQSVPKRGCLKSKGFFVSDDFDSDALGFEDFWNGQAQPQSTKAKGRRRANKSKT